MNRESVLIGIGVVVALSPFLGLPLSLLSVLLPLLGIATTAIAVTLRVRKAQMTVRPESPPARVLPVYDSPQV